MSQPVDLPRVRRTLARLSAHLEAHPEIADRTARWLDAAHARIQRREMAPWLTEALERLRQGELNAEIEPETVIELDDGDRGGQ